MKKAQRVRPDLTSRSAKYREWLDFLFARCDAGRPRYQGLDVEPFNSSPRETVQLFTTTMLRCGSDLLEFSNLQVSRGLEYVFHNGVSDTVFDLMSDEVPVEERLKAIRSIRVLYSDCFESRCSPCLCHLGQEGNELNGVCYMLWDVTPLNFWEGRAEKATFYAAVVELLETVLVTTRNPACLESALHGLAHTKPYAAKGSVQAAIDHFLKQQTKLMQEVARYAQLARDQYVE